MTANSNVPLTPVELFRRGIEITREIRGRIEEARAYYLGRSSREPEEPLSEVFDPMRGPILRYFIATIRIITRPSCVFRSDPTVLLRTVLLVPDPRCVEIRQWGRRPRPRYFHAAGRQIKLPFSPTGIESGSWKRDGRSRGMFL